MPVINNKRDKINRFVDEDPVKKPKRKGAKTGDKIGALAFSGDMKYWRSKSKKGKNLF